MDREHEAYKYLFRNAQVQGVKNGLKAAAGVAGAVASFAAVIVTKGKVNPKK